MEDNNVEAKKHMFHVDKTHTKCGGMKAVAESFEELNKLPNGRVLEVD